MAIATNLYCYKNEPRGGFKARGNCSRDRLAAQRSRHQLKLLFRNHHHFGISIVLRKTKYCTRTNRLWTIVPNKLKYGFIALSRFEPRVWRQISGSCRQCPTANRDTYPPSLQQRRQWNARACSTVRYPPLHDHLSVEIFHTQNPCLRTYRKLYDNQRFVRHATSIHLSLIPHARPSSRHTTSVNQNRIVLDVVPSAMALRFHCRTHLRLEQYLWSPKPCN